MGNARQLGIVTLLAATLTWFVPATPVAADQLSYAPQGRGEVARLGRQLYDFHYRNSNNNVFRRSNHFHPTKNVFRSSKYYKQRLAASYDGYPVRTIFHDFHDGRGGDRRSIVHHRRQPYGPSYDPYYGGYYRPIVGYAAPDDRPVVVVVQQAAPEPEPRPRPLTREDIEMVPIRVAPREATQKAVIEKVTLPDGTVRTVIRSVPKASASEKPADASDAPAAETTLAGG